jgi:hypothetical protein
VTAASRTGWALCVAARACALALASCAAAWPDERGVPVEVSYAENERAADAFRVALVAARAGTTLPEPTASPSRQTRIRQIADALQRGDTSAPRARDAARRWGERVFGRAVDAWVLDCTHGQAKMSLPGDLTSPPVLAIAYAASQFRPASRATVQCALIVVSARGGERVGPTSAAGP